MFFFKLENVDAIYHFTNDRFSVFKTDKKLFTLFV